MRRAPHGVPVSACGAGRARLCAVPDRPHSPAEEAALERVLAESRRRGFLGPGDVMFHVEHARAFFDALDNSPPESFLDLGSGGGVPGLILARLLPPSRVVLLDAMAKRCHFLEWAIGQLGLGDRATVECGRAEQLARRDDLRGRFPVVVTRSFGPPSVTAECAAGFLRSPGGHLLVSEPPAPDPGRWPTEGLAVLGLVLGARVQRGTATVQILSSSAELGERYPRRTGVPEKRPLF